MAVLELCELMDIPARIGEITKDELLEADEVFMASTAGGIMPIRRIDDRILSRAPRADHDPASRCLLDQA